MKKTWRRNVLYALVAVLLGLATVFFPLLGVDLYLHEKFNRKFIGYNYRGYRGDVLSKKEDSVFRVAFLGGSTALGYGVGWQQTLPYVLQENLCAALGPGRAEVANLGWNVQGVYSFPFTLQAYRDLEADIYVFYQGYNDGGINMSDWRKSSVCFRLTGYMPIWPLIFREKAGAILSGGRLDDWYRGKVRFNPNLAQKLAASTLQGMVAGSESMAGILSAWVDNKVKDAPGEWKDQKNPWAFYLYFTDQSIQIALSQGGQVLLLGQPRIGSWHQEQQDALRKFWKEKYSKNSSVAYLDLAKALDLKDPELAPDGMHLSYAGHQKLAPLVSKVLLQMKCQNTNHK